MSPDFKDMPLQHNADLDPEFSEDTHDKPQLDVHLTVFIAFDGTYQGFGEFMAHVAGNSHSARDP